MCFIVIINGQFFNNFKMWVDPQIFFLFRNFELVNMAFLKSNGEVETYAELKRWIAELDNPEIVKNLEALNLDTSGTRKMKCARLRRGIKLLKGWPSRNSDYTREIGCVKRRRGDRVGFQK